MQSCLAALADAACDEAEYIVVDDGCTDGFDDTIAAASIPVQVIRMGVQTGAAAARNSGASAASGDILFFLDADTCVNRETLPKILACFRRDAALGALFGAYDDQPTQRNFYSQYRNLLHCYVHRESSGPACTFWTGCGAIRRSTFVKHGGFDESPWNVDDIEFGNRLSNDGVHIELHPDITVCHQKRWTFLSTLRTDLLLRGVPWTLLILRQQRIPNVLNVSYANRVSVVLVTLAILASLVSLGRTAALDFSAACLFSAACINNRFYQFLWKRRGPMFAARAIPAHLFHFAVCALSFSMGSIAFARELFTSREPMGVLSDLE